MKHEYKDEILNRVTDMEDDDLINMIAPHLCPADTEDAVICNTNCVLCWKLYIQGMSMLERNKEM